MGQAGELSPSSSFFSQEPYLSPYAKVSFVLIRGPPLYPHSWQVLRVLELSIGELSWCPQGHQALEMFLPASVPVLVTHMWSLGYGLCGQVGVQVCAWSPVQLLEQTDIFQLRGPSSNS